ncbi:MAG TPA: GNAT family N-acetyltransferase [Polyangiaceae bacterium]|nr:GNAT family N-acetyltransferase [Polyangiaceae bacterium]
MLWNIDWANYLPVTVVDDIDVEYGSFASASEFISRHYAEIFEQLPGASAFTGGQSSTARSRYYHSVADFFQFTHEQRIVGLLVCTPLDWSTYYLRSGALLPEYQNSKLMQRFVPLIFATLARAGVERIETDTSPSNLRMMQLLTHLGFNVSGTVLTERWGAHVHFTKFLDAKSEQIFLEQFCVGVKYQLRKERDHEEEVRDRHAVSSA